jgi:hypothetical protein
MRSVFEIIVIGQTSERATSDDIHKRSIQRTFARRSPSSSLQTLLLFSFSFTFAFAFLLPPRSLLRRLPLPRPRLDSLFDLLNLLLRQRRGLLNDGANGVLNVGSDSVSLLGNGGLRLLDRLLAREEEGEHWCRTRDIERDSASGLPFAKESRDEKGQSDHSQTVIMPNTVANTAPAAAPVAGIALNAPTGSTTAKSTNCWNLN